MLFYIVTYNSMMSGLMYFNSVVYINDFVHCPGRTLFTLQEI